MRRRTHRAPKTVVIVVDDEESIRLSVRSFLRAEGHRVLLATCGKDALRICMQFRPAIDLMITDVQMPGISGFILAEEVAALRPRMPVLFMSGSYRQDGSELCNTAGAGRAFVEKPVSFAALEAKLKSMLASD